MSSSCPTSTLHSALQQRSSSGCSTVVPQDRNDQLPFAYQHHMHETRFHPQYQTTLRFTRSSRHFNLLSSPASRPTWLLFIRIHVEVATGHLVAKQHVLYLMGHVFVPSPRLFSYADKDAFCYLPTLTKTSRISSACPAEVYAACTLELTLFMDVHVQISSAAC